MYSFFGFFGIIKNMSEKDNEKFKITGEKITQKPHTPEEQEKIVLEKIKKNAHDDAEEFLAHFQQMSSMGVFKVIRGVNIKDKEIINAAFESAKHYNLSEKDKKYYLEEFYNRCVLGYPLGKA